MTKTNRWLMASIVSLASLIALLVGCDQGPTQPPDTEPSFGTEQVQDQAFTVGTAITALVLPAATGGNAPLTYSLTPDVPGLEFLPAARMLSGTPTAAAEGVHAMTYRVEDADGDVARLTFNVRVDPAPVADIQPSFGGQTVTDQTYTVGVYIGLLELPRVSGGNPPLTATLTPEVPGLMFLPWVPALTGTPTEAAEGDHSMTYRVEDVDGDFATLTFTVRVNPASVADTEPSFGQQTVSDHTFWVGSSIVPLVLPAATGGDGTLIYSLTPAVPGLTFDASTRTLSGTPAAEGAHAMTYRVEDSDGDFATLTFEVRVNPADTEPSFGAQTVANQTYTVGTLIARLVLPAATGGDGTLTYSLTPAVPGLTFDASTRTLSGTPAAEGDHAMTYRVEDSDGDFATLTFEVRIDPADTEPSFGAQTVANQTYTVGTLIARLVLPAATGGDGTLTYSLTPAVPGLTFDASTRTLSGTPAAEGDHAMTYRVEDSDGDFATLRFDVRVTSPPPMDTRPSFGAQTVPDQTYTVGTLIARLVLPAATGGNGTLNYTLRPTVPGLTFDGGTRALTGTPTKAGGYAITYTVTDTDGDADTLTFTVTVTDPGLIYEPLPDVQHCLTIQEGGSWWDGLRNSCSVHIHFFFCYPNPRNSTNIRHGLQCGTNERDDDQPYYTGRRTVPSNGGISFGHWGDEYHYAVCHNDVNKTGGNFVSDDEGNYGCYSRRRTDADL